MENFSEEINKALRIDFKPFQLRKVAGPRREQAIKEAMSWPKGQNQEGRIFTCLYTFGDYKIGVNKPGKEAAPDYKRCRNRNGQYTNNPNDMLPTIFFRDERIDENLSFRDIFERLHTIAREDEGTLELLGCLLFRTGFMLDHEQVSEGVLRFGPPEPVLKEIERRIPKIGNLPTRVFLHLVEVLSLNEDVKYWTLGYDTIWDAYGRRNNLLTCVHMVAVSLNKVSFVKFAGSMARPPVGIAPISIKTAFEVFPSLRGKGWESSESSSDS